MYFYKKSYQQTPQQQNTGINILTRRRTPTPDRDRDNQYSASTRNQSQRQNNIPSNINLQNQAFQTQKQPPRHPVSSQKHQPKQSQDLNPIRQNNLADYLHSPGNVHPDTGRGDKNQKSYFNQSNTYAKSEEKQFKGTGRISKISANRSNLSKLTTNQNQQKRMLQGQYGIRNLSHSRSRSKMKTDNHSQRPRGDISPDSPDFRTPEENIGSYFVPKTDPGGMRKINHKQVSISGASDIQEFKRKFINQQKHNQGLQQNVGTNQSEVPHIRIVMRKDKNQSKQISHLSRPFNEIGMFSNQQSLSNINDNYSASGMPLETEQNQNDKGIGGTIYNTFSKLAQNINTLARQSMRSESFEDKEPLAHFGNQKSPREPQNEVNDSYFNDIQIPKQVETKKGQNETIRESREFLDKKLEVIRSSDQLLQDQDIPRNSTSQMDQKISNLDKSLNVSDREKMQTLQKLSDQLNDLNSNLMNKLSDKIQMNFEKELQTIRSLSHLSRSRVSSHSRSRTPKRSNTPKGFGETQSDGSGSYKRTTLVSGLTFDDLSNMDISEGDIIKQSKAADMKIQLLQKQIIMMEQRAKLEGLTDRLATEENPINVNDLGRQSHKENKDNKLFNDLLRQSNKQEDLENLIVPQAENSSGIRVDKQLKDRFTPSQKVEEPNAYDKQSEIQSLLDNLPLFNKDGGLHKESNIETNSPPRQIEVKEEYSTNDQQYIDKIQDRQLNQNPSVSGDSMIKLTKEFERQNNEKELNDLVSIKSTKSKQTEKNAYQDGAYQSIQTFKDKPKVEVNQSSRASTQKQGHGEVINYSGSKQHYTIETNEEPYQQNNISKRQSDQDFVSPDRTSNTSIRTDRTIDNQYVDQLNLLIQMLGRDPDTSFYGNQCQIFVGCHKTYLKQREVWQRLRAKSVNIQIHPPKPDIPCEKVVEGLNMMKEGIKSHFEGVQGKKMFASQLEMQFYMVITLLEGFVKQLEEEEEEFNTNKKPVSISNNTQHFDAKKLDSMSQKSFSVKSQAVQQVRGLTSEKSIRQSQNYETNIQNAGYDQTIYKNNASEQGLRAGSRNKIRQSQGNLNETIGNQSVMSQPISSKIMFVGAGALDSPKMDDCSDNSNNTPEHQENRDTVQQIQTSEQIYNVQQQITTKNISQSESKPQPQKVEAHNSMQNQYSQEQPNRRNMIKRSDNIDEGNADISPSPIGRERAQVSVDLSAPGKNQLVSSSLNQSQSNSVFQSIKSPQIQGRADRYLNANDIKLSGKLPAELKNSNHTSVSNKNVSSMIYGQNNEPRQSYQQSLLDNSMRSASKLSAQDRLYNARNKLNSRLDKEAEKMSSQAPSVTRSIGGVKIPDNARELSQKANRMRSPNIFSKKTGDKDDASKSKSRTRVNLFARDLSQGNMTKSQVSGRLGGSRASIGVHSGNNYSDFGNASNVITFKEFTKLSNNILKKNFMKEQYAQLVSIPSLYKKMCQQLLSGIQDDIEQEELEGKVNEFIKIEYRKQINAYKAQFNEPQHEMKQTPQPAVPRNEETSADRIPLSPHQQFEIKPMKQAKIENVTYSFAGQSSPNTANFQADNNESGHLKKERSIVINDISATDSKMDSNEGQLTLGKNAKIESPSRVERKNLFKGKGENTSNGGSSMKKRSRIVDKSAERNIVPVKSQILLDPKDDNRDIQLVLEEFNKQDTMKNSQGHNSNANQSNGTPRFKNKKVNLPAVSISSSINRIPPSTSSPSPKNIDPYKRPSKGHSKMMDSSANSNRQSTQSNNSQQKQPPRKSAKRITYDDVKNPFGSAGQNK